MIDIFGHMSGIYVYMPIFSDNLSWIHNIYLKYSYHSRVDAETAATKLSEDMNRITTWCCSNSLLVNPGKTKLLFNGHETDARAIAGEFSHNSF